MKRAFDEDAKGLRPQGQKAGWNVARMELVLAHRRGWQMDMRHELTPLKVHSEAQGKEECIRCEVCNRASAANKLTTHWGILDSFCGVGKGNNTTSVLARRGELHKITEEGIKPPTRKVRLRKA